MDSKQIEIEAILEKVRTHITEFVETHKEIQCPIEYETKLLEIGLSVSKDLMIHTAGKIPRSKNQKKSLYSIR
jgi:hypothetical protein